jgi:hypothetical protein
MSAPASSNPHSRAAAPSSSIRTRTEVEAKSCGSAARGIVLIDDSVGTRPESVVKRRGSRGPLRGGDTKAPLTWGSPRGLCWVRKKSSISLALCYYKHSNFRTRGRRIGQWYLFSIGLEKDLRSARSGLRLWRSLGLELGVLSGPSSRFNIGKAPAAGPEHEEAGRASGLTTSPRCSLLVGCCAARCWWVVAAPSRHRPQPSPAPVPPLLRRLLDASLLGGACPDSTSKTFACAPANRGQKKISTDLEKQSLLAHVAPWKPGATAKEAEAVAQKSVGWMEEAGRGSAARFGWRFGLWMVGPLAGERSLPCCFLLASAGPGSGWARSCVR